MAAPNERIRLLYVDLFCGAGGTSTGVENAVVNGRKIAKVVACVNHDSNAIASHKANHPDAIHYTEDIRTLELGPMIRHLTAARKAYPEAKVVLWASLECTNFSRAKGGQSRDADSRTLAEHLFRYVEAIRPDAIQIENVEEFMSWGPLIEKRRKDGSVVLTKKSAGKGKKKVSWEEPAMIPDPAHAGDYYRRWVSQMCAYGYRFEHRILNSADYGAYTSRKRFFGMFAAHGFPMVFPTPTHAKNPQRSLFGEQLHPWRPVREVLDLEDEGTSIFDRRKPLVEATMRRILAGLQKFVGDEKAFFVKYNGMKDGRYAPPALDDPSPTLAAQQRLAVAKATFLTKAYGGNPSEKCQRVDAPAGSITTRDHHQFITTYYGRGGIHSTENPAPTITPKDRLAMVYLDNQYGTGAPTSLDAPCGTITGLPKQNPVSVHFLSNAYSFKSNGSSVNRPAPTVIARQDKAPLQLVTTNGGRKRLPSFIRRDEDGSLTYEILPGDNEPLRAIKEFMASHGIVDISMRMLRIRELKLIQGFPADYILVGTQEQQKKYLGNAVVTVMAKAWCEAVAQNLRPVFPAQFRARAPVGVRRSRVYKRPRRGRP